MPILSVKINGKRNGWGLDESNHGYELFCKNGKLHYHNANLFYYKYDNGFKFCYCFEGRCHNIEGEARLGDWFIHGIIMNEAYEDYI